MSWPRVLVIALAGGTAGLCLFASVAAAASNDLNSATSVSRQFTTYAPGRLLPHALCVFAEQVRREWASTLDLGPEWRDPIILTVRERAADESSLRSPTVGVARTDLHLRFSILYLTPPALEQDLLVNALVEALCGEWANRHQSVGRDQPYVAAPIPPWISLGLSRLVRGRDERLRRLVQRSMASDRPAGALRILTAAEVPVDLVDRHLFEAAAAVLLEGLLQLPDGRERLRGFLVQCGATKSAWRAFWASYSGQFRDEEALERWWALQVASESRMGPVQNLSLQASGEALKSVLTTALTFTDPAGGSVAVETIPLERFWRQHDAPWFNSQLNQKQIKLVALRQQGNPLYRDVIEEYLTALRWLEKRYFNRFRRALRVARAREEQANQIAAGVRECLDQFETTHGSGLPPSSVNNFFQAIERLELDDARRRSPIRDYLDQFDR